MQYGVVNCSEQLALSFIIRIILEMNALGPMPNRIHLTTDILP